MKRIKLIICMVLCVALCGCVNTPVNIDGSKTDSNADLNYSLWCNQGFESLDELNQYLDEFDVNDEVFPYDAIAEWGEFDFLVFISLNQWTEDGRVRSESHSRYNYTVINDAGDSITIRVEPLDVGQYINELPILTDEQINPSDMRTSVNNAKGRYVYNNITYAYSVIGLVSISWVADGLRYYISADSHFNDYSLTGDPMTAQVLNLNTSEAAINALMNSIQS